MSWLLDKDLDPLQVFKVPVIIPNAPKLWNDLSLWSFLCVILLVGFYMLLFHII